MQFSKNFCIFDFSKGFLENDLTERLFSTVLKNDNSFFKYDVSIVKPKPESDY